MEKFPNTTGFFGFGDIISSTTISFDFLVHSYIMCMSNVCQSNYSMFEIDDFPCLSYV